MAEATTHRGVLVVEYRMDLDAERDEDGRALGSSTEVNVSVCPWGEGVPDEDMVVVWTSGIAEWAERAEVSPVEILADMASALTLSGGDPVAELQAALGTFGVDGEEG